MAVLTPTEGLGSFPDVLGWVDVAFELVNDIFGVASVVAKVVVLNKGVGTFEESGK